MQNVGRVMSRNMIIEHVWDQSFDGATNIVDVYVRHLRAKVDDEHEFKLLRTVRGSGYMIRHEGRNMKIRSLRARVTSWYIGLLAAALVAFGASLYFGFRHYLETRP